MTAESPPRVARREVRSYVLRAGRITTAQRRALAELWPRYGIELGPDPLDLERVFGRRAPRVLEIGFGDGELLAQMAHELPGTDFLGIEVHQPGIGHCLLLIEQLGLCNLRLIAHDAVEVLRQQLPDASLNRVNLFFPDPWPKKRHHKRRIVQPEFARLVAAKLAPGGVFHVATDWGPYGAHIDAVMTAEPAFESLPAADALRATTKFERRGERLGHEIYERVWRRCTGPRG
jgi:tRNA (guanine-N7-)-methyltransferase